MYVIFKLNQQTLERLGISVIIPNYNGRKLLEQIIPPLLTALIYTGNDYEIIISDDCSADDSIKFLRENYPQIIILESEKNKGFSPTINKGIFFAKQPFLFLLNSDVKLTENYFTSMFRYFDKEDTFGVMGRIIGWSEDEIQDGAKYPSYHGAKIKTTGNYIASEPRKDDWLFSMYLSGANAFVSREKILRLNGFDELFAPFYVEDYELSLRAWRIGWKCYYEHFAICRHQISMSIKSKNSKTFINSIYYRNKMFLHAMHLTGVKRMVWYLQLIPESLIRLFTGRFYYFKSLQLFFQNRKKLKQSRQKFSELGRQNNKLLSVGRVVDNITNSLANRSIRRF